MQKGILLGTESGIEPDRTVTRAEFVSMITRTLELLPSTSSKIIFDDVTPWDWHYMSIMAAYENKIVSGTDASHFSPNAPITRQDAVCLLGRAFRIPERQIFNVTEFPDGVQISDYAMGYMGAFSSMHMLSGYDDSTIRPLATLTRAEAVTIIERTTHHEPLQAVSFNKGYPLISQNLLANGFSITLKTTRPCTVYYVLADSSRIGSNIVPKANEINNKLIDIPTADTEMTCFISAPSNTEYTIYFVAVTEDGAKSRVAWIKNARSHIYTSGSGTKNDPYLIYNPEQLSNISHHPDKHYRLENDIVLPQDFTSICTQLEFNGTFDGNGHTISNLSLSTYTDDVGLFSKIGRSGIVKNLYVDAVEVVGENNVGILAGENKGTIQKCQTNGTVLSKDNIAGGIAGTNTGTIKDSFSSAVSVKSSTYSGGIAGVNNGSILNCASYCQTVTADMYSGGISSINSGGTIENCVAANMNILSLITTNSSRITVNRVGGKTKNNYAYDQMNTSVSDGYTELDGQNGEDISWDKITNVSFYKDNLFWDIQNVWTISRKTDFVCASLQSMPQVRLVRGETPYAPKKIATEDELSQIDNNRFGHYILTDNIALTKPWTPIADEQSLLTDNSNGFSGTLDGHGYTISNLHVPYQYDRKMYGLFGMITGGSVRNLNLEAVKIDSCDYIGAVTGINYGYITDCKVSGEISSSRNSQSALFLGSIAGANYGHILSSDAKTTISVHGNDTSIGGICGYNENTVENCAYTGSMNSSGSTSRSSTVIGGICGYNADGFVYGTYSNAQITVATQTAYAGGSVGMLDSGEIYMSSTKGKIDLPSTKGATGYGGGITGLSSGGLIFQSFSNTAVDAKCETSYIGGISGYNVSCNIQENYTTNTLTQTISQKSYAGGICGVNEHGFVVSNVAINPSIIGTGARICPKSEGDTLDNNFAFSRMSINYKSVADTIENGTGVDYSELKNLDFFLLPVDKGGRLGWSSTKYSGTDGVWTGYPQTNALYPFPLLNNVKYQDMFSVPVYDIRK